MTKAHIFYPFLQSLMISRTFVLIAISALTALSSDTNAQPAMTATGHDGVTLRIKRYDPPLVIYEGELEMGRRSPDWLDAFTTFHWPNHLDSYADWLKIMTPTTHALGLMPPERFQVVQIDPSSYAFYQPEFHIHRAIHLSSTNATYVIIEQEWVSHETNGGNGRMFASRAFAQTPSGWKCLLSQQPTWLNYLIMHDDERLLEMMEQSAIPDLDMSIQDIILSDGLDVSPDTAMEAAPSPANEQHDDPDASQGATAILSQQESKAEEAESKRTRDIMLAALVALVGAGGFILLRKRSKRQQAKEQR